jgi:hypothetical protein
MSGPFGSQQWTYNAGGSFYPYSIDQSLRFNDDDSAKLYFDPTSDGNKQVWTFSAWVKRGNLGLNYATFFSGTNSSGHQTDIRFDSADQLRVVTAGASLTMDFKTNRVFRDVGSWYHIVVAVDTTDATLLNRVKIYVNGVQETSLATTTCTQNTNCILNTASNQTTNVGALGYTTTVNKEFDGYMAEVHFVDGTQYAASDFGETINGIWVPKEVSGLTYGTNGFYLSFADSAAIGDDLSGNTNDFTVIQSVASDVVPDSPTNNFATLSTVDNAQGATISEGNLRAANASATDKRYHSTSGMTTGKWYWEVRVNTAGTRNQIGVFSDDNTAGTSFPTNYAYIGVGNSSGATSGTFNGTKFTASNGDIVTFAFDADNGNLYYGQNSAPTIGATADISGLATDTYLFGCRETSSSPGNNTLNFGQEGTFVGTETAGGNSDDNGYGDFKYAPPSGFLALCSANLPEATIGPNSTTQADDYFNTVLYTGDGSNGQAITGVGFQPDWLWIKSRSGTAYHELHDSVRGAGTRLFSNDPAAESAVGTVSSFDSDGFTVSRNSVYDGTNQSGVSFVGWNWKAGGTASTIAVDIYSTGVPSIASSVSANQDAGFSVVSYSGVNTTTGQTSTIGHGLASAPELIICKRRNSAQSWSVGSTAIGNFTTSNVYSLDSTGAPATTWADEWGANPTSTVFTTGYSNRTNISGGTFIAYCFHSVEGFSKHGTYVGNANANGPFVFTGFRPAFVLLKVSSAVNNWFIYDNIREGYNQDNDTLSPNLTSVEDTSYKLDLVSNGFKIRGSNNAHNQSGQTFIYLAFAEAPFKYANAR